MCVFRFGKDISCRKKANRPFLLRSIKSNVNARLIAHQTYGRLHQDWFLPWHHCQKPFWTSHFANWTLHKNQMEWCSNWLERNRSFIVILERLRETGMIYSVKLYCTKEYVSWKFTISSNSWERIYAEILTIYTSLDQYFRLDSTTIVKRCRNHLVSVYSYFEKKIELMKMIDF